MLSVAASCQSLKLGSWKNRARDDFVEAIGKFFD